MTCLIGLEHAGKVYLAGDSFIGGPDGDWYDLTAQPKVRRIGSVAFGVCGRSAPEQALTAVLLELRRKKLPESWVSESLPWLLRAKCASIRAVDADGDMIGNSAFLIAVGARLYSMTSDYGVYRSSRGFATLGAGESWAAGAMTILQKGKAAPEAKLRAALVASAENCPSVRAPYHIVST